MVHTYDYYLCSNGCGSILNLNQTPGPPPACIEHPRAPPEPLPSPHLLSFYPKGWTTPGHPLPPLRPHPRYHPLPPVWINKRSILQKPITGRWWDRGWFPYITSRPPVPPPALIERLWLPSGTPWKHPLPPLRHQPRYHPLPLVWINQ